MSEDEQELDQLRTFRDVARITAASAMLLGIWSALDLAFVVASVGWLAAAFFTLRTAPVLERLGESGGGARRQAAVHLVVGLAVLVLFVRP